MLVKEPKQKITIDQILNHSLILQLNNQQENLNKCSPLISFSHPPLSREFGSLHFAHDSDDSKGIMKFLSEIPFHKFLNEIGIKVMHKGNGNLFKFLCFSDSLSLAPTKHCPAFQFSFQRKKVLVEGFSISLNSSKFP
jgi:hypothetical protein